MKFGQSFKPMLLVEVDKPFDDEDYLYELKFDGYRATMHVGPDKFIIYSRNGLDITHLYPELREIQKMVKNKVIFDGEIVCLNEGLPDFSLLQKRSHSKDKARINYYKENYPVCFVAFDCLYLDGSLIDKSLLQRKEKLSNFDDNNYFIKVDYIFKEGKKLFSRVKKNGLEGIVAKKIDSGYEIDKRSHSWLKIKNLKDGKFLIGGYKNSKGDNTAILYLGEYKNSKFIFVGKVLLGVKNNLYNDITKLKKINESPFDGFLEEDVFYIEPKISCEVTYLERTKNGLRHPVFKR